MQKIFLLSCAFGTLASISLLGSDNQYPFTIGVGYRHDQVHWNANYFTNQDLTFTIPGVPSVSGVANEKVRDKYNNLNMIQITAGLETVWHHIYVNGTIGYGYIGQGHANHRMKVRNDNILLGGTSTDPLEETHYSQQGKSMGDAFDAEGDIGVQIALGNTTKAHITPYVGYMYDYEKIKQTYEADSIEQIRFINPLTLRLDPKKTNRFHWSGPVFGFFLDYSPNRFLTLKGGYSFHWVNMHQRIHEDFTVYVTNNSTQILSQSIDAKIKSHNGTGHRGYLAAFYALTQKWKIGLDLKYQYFNSHHGKIHGHDFVSTSPALGFEAQNLKIHDKGAARWWSFQSMFEVQYEF